MSRCTVCGLRIIPVADCLVHPACEDTAEAARIRAEHAAAEAGLLGQHTAATGSPDDFTLALDIIRVTACRLRVFTANDIADPNSPLHDPRWQHLGSKVPGAAMGTASRKRWCHKSGRTRPALSAKGHHIPEWISDIYVDEFKAGLLSVAANSPFVGQRESA